MPRGKKTTMAKLSREARLRERRLDKKARKDARKRQAAEGIPEGYNPAGSETAGGELVSADEPDSVGGELAPDSSRSDTASADSP
jgi:hypothetical protein